MHKRLSALSKAIRLRPRLIAKSSIWAISSLGPEYLTPKGLEHMDPASREGQEIVSIIESLDKSCED
jgi:hypothetical protein